MPKLDNFNKWYNTFMSMTYKELVSINNVLMHDKACSKNKYQALIKAILNKC